MKQKKGSVSGNFYRPFRVLVTMGDPAGVGPEIIVRSLASIQTEDAAIVVIGDKGPLEIAQHLLGIKVKLQEIRDISKDATEAGAKYLLPLSFLKKVVLGRPTIEGARASYEYIAFSLRTVLKGEAEAIVTAPVSKRMIAAAGYPFWGHTEFLAQMSGTEDFAMMLVGPRLKVSLVTTHLPLSEVPHALSCEKIVKVIGLTYKALKYYFGIKKPKLVLCSLNPHAGEEGHLGDEEKKLLEPAILKVRKRGVLVEGPFPADSAFYWAYVGRWDAIIALYHDQGLAPFKLLYFHEGVNLTLGLPFIRTSPDHGTAFDIAGKGIANHQSMENALRLAIDILKRVYKVYQS